MPEQETDELKERLQAFARELASAEDRLVGGLDDDEHQPSGYIERLHARHDELEAKVRDAKKQTGLCGVLKKELATDISALEKDFNHWMQRLDQRMKRWSA